jgi:hypothetical protein
MTKSELGIRHSFLILVSGFSGSDLGSFVSLLLCFFATHFKVAGGIMVE